MRLSIVVLFSSGCLALLYRHLEQRAEIGWADRRQERFDALGRRGCTQERLAAGLGSVLHDRRQRGECIAAIKRRLHECVRRGTQQVVLRHALQAARTLSGT